MEAIVCYPPRFCQNFIGSALTHSAVIAFLNEAIEVFQSLLSFSLVMKHACDIVPDAIEIAVGGLLFGPIA